MTLQPPVTPEHRQVPVDGTLPPPSRLAWTSARGRGLKLGVLVVSRPHRQPATAMLGERPRDYVVQTF